jgi:uncharacterized membrane protein
MTSCGNLWAIGYDDMARAAQVREEIAKLGEKHCLILVDSAVAVRYPDGSVTLDGEPFVNATNVRGHSFASFLAALALGAPPLTGAAVGTLLRATGQATSGEDGIDEEFVCEVERMMKPGTSALFVLDQGYEQQTLLQGIRGLGGTVLKTTVDLKWAEKIQSILSAAASDAP